MCDGHPRNETDQKHCARQRSLVVEAPYINVQGEHQKPINTEGAEEERRVFTLFHKFRRPKKIHNRHNGNHHSPNGPSINNEIIHNDTFNGLTPQRYEDSATLSKKWSVQLVFISKDQALRAKDDGLRMSLPLPKCDRRKVSLRALA